MLMPVASPPSTRIHTCSTLTLLEIVQSTPQNTNFCLLQGFLYHVISPCSTLGHAKKVAITLTIGHMPSILFYPT